MQQRQRQHLDRRQVRIQRQDVYGLGLRDLLLAERELWRDDGPLRRRLPEQLRDLQQRQRCRLDGW